VQRQRSILMNNLSILESVRNNQSLDAPVKQGGCLTCKG
jgi:hypothetical protein